MTTDNRTNEPTPNPTAAERIMRMVVQRHPVKTAAMLDLLGELSQAGILLSEGAPVKGSAKLLQNSGPSEEQIARMRRMLRPFGLGDACTDRDLRQALTAAGVAPQDEDVREQFPETVAFLRENARPLGIDVTPPTDREKLIAEADGWTSHRQIHDHAVSALDTIHRLRDALAVPLDPEKVAEVLDGNHFIEHGPGYGEHLALTPEACRHFARAICEAAKRGELT